MPSLSNIQAPSGALEAFAGSVSIATVVVIGAGMLHLGNRNVTTEEAAMIFATFAGIGGAAANILGGRRLGKIDADEIELKRVYPALLATIFASAAAGALLMPNQTGYLDGVLFDLA